MVGPDLLQGLDAASAVPPPKAAPFDLAVAAEILSSGAPGAFLARRLEQWLKHGHSPADDEVAPLDRLVRAADERLRHALDKLSPEGGDLAYALRKIEIAGACLIAAHDQLSARLERERRP